MSNAIFPTLPGLKWDVVKKPEFSSQVMKSVSGKEIRAAYYGTPIWHWSLSFEFLRDRSGLMEYDALSSFFNQRQGGYDSFLFADPNDSGANNIGFAVGDGATASFQLQRPVQGNYTDGFGTWPVYTAQRTNLAKRSEDLSTTWVSTFESGTTITTNACVAPDGNMTADRVSYDGTGTAGGLRVYNPVLTAPAAWVQYTASVWLRSDIPMTVGMHMNLPPSPGGTVVIQQCAIGPVWKRFTISGFSNGASNLQLQLRSATGDNNPFDFYAWGAQAELGPTATRYIGPTLGASMSQTPQYWPATGESFEPVYNLNPAAEPSDPGSIQRLWWYGSRPVYNYERRNWIFECLDFNSASTNWNRVSTTAAYSSVICPDGSTDGCLFNDNASNTAHYIYWSGGSTTWADNSPIVFSVYAKQNAQSILQLRLNTKDPFYGYANFDLSAGTASIVATGSAVGVTCGIAPAGNGWYRCWIALPSTSTGASQILPLACLTGGALTATPVYVGSSNGIYMFGAQCEIGVTTPTELMKSNSRYMLFGEKEFLQTPTIYKTDWAGWHPLYPWARTNFCLQSAAFDNATWGKLASGTGVAPVVTPNVSAAAPDGSVNTADQVVFNTAAGSTTSDYSMLSQTLAGLTPGRDYTLSFWIKGTAGDQLVVRGPAGSTYTKIFINGFWQRIVLTETAAVANPSLNIGIRQGSISGNGTLQATSTVFMWGAQVEVGHAATEYIPTTTVAVTVTDYTLSSSGVVTPAAVLAAGVALSWSGAYFWRVRFKDDSAEFNNFAYQFWELKKLELVSVK